METQEASDHGEDRERRQPDEEKMAKAGGGKPEMGDGPRENGI